MDTADRCVYRRSASRMKVFAHIFGILTIVLLLVWLLHYQGGFDLDSDNPDRIFNVHPFLMIFGFIFFAGEGMMAYKSGLTTQERQKFAHFFLHSVAITLGIVGLHAVFKFHEQANISNMYSLHSWIGMGTFCLFILQWLFGLLYLLKSSSRETRSRRYLPWHITGGRALVYMAICAAETGLMEKVTFLKIQYNRESRLINILGLAILLFGITVDLSVGLASYG